MSEYTLQDSINEMRDMHPIYYRLFVDGHDELVVVCMQDFDEYDYDQKRFINTKQYETEERAEAALLAYKFRARIPLTTLEKLKLIATLESESAT